jgi:hypothetical protein
MTFDIWFATGMELKDGRWIPGNHGAQDSITWETLVDALTFDEIPFERMADHVKDLKGDEADKPWKKGDGCWIPALLKTDAEGNTLGRKKDSIVHYSCIVLDIDEGGDAAAVEAALQARDLAFIIHSTYSHNRLEEGTDRFRVVVPLDRPVEGETQYKVVLDQVALLAGGGEFPAGFDPASRNYSQAFWFPSYPPERANQSFRITNNGKPYEWHSPDLLDIEAQLPNHSDAVADRQPITMQMIMPQVLEGSRNDTLFRSLCQWLREQPKLPPAADVVAAGVAMMQDRRTFPKPLQNNEVRAVALSALKAIQKEAPDKIVLPDLIVLSDLKAQPVEWLIDGQLVLGELTIIQGLPKSGKSLVCMHWAAELSKQGIKTLISHAEDSPERTLTPRQWAAGAVPEHVLLIPDEALMELPEGITILRQYIIKVDAKLVFIDAINNWMPSKGVENDRFLRSCLQPLAKLAQELNIAIVASRHFTKDGNNTDAMSRGSGGQAYTAVARQVMQVVGGEENSHPEYPDHVLLSTVTGQHIAKATTWAFKRTAIEMPMEEKSAWVPYLKAGVEVPLSASEILKAVSPLHKTNSRKGNCAAAIIDELNAAGGRMLTGMLRETMIATHQYPPATYERALKALGDERKIETRRGRNQEVSLVV